MIILSFTYISYIIIFPTRTSPCLGHRPELFAHANFALLTAALDLPRTNPTCRRIVKGDWVSGRSTVYSYHNPAATIACEVLLRPSVSHPGRLVTVVSYRNQHCSGSICGGTMTLLKPPCGVCVSVSRLLATMVATERSLSSVSFAAAVAEALCSGFL